MLFIFIVGLHLLMCGCSRELPVTWELEIFDSDGASVATVPLRQMVSTSDITLLGDRIAVIGESTENLWLMQLYDLDGEQISTVYFGRFPERPPVSFASRRILYPSETGRWHVRLYDLDARVVGHTYWEVPITKQLIIGGETRILLLAQAEDEWRIKILDFDGKDRIRLLGGYYHPGEEEKNVLGPLTAEPIPVMSRDHIAVLLKQGDTWQMKIWRLTGAELSTVHLGATLCDPIACVTENRIVTVTESDGGWQMRLYTLEGEFLSAVPLFDLPCSSPSIFAVAQSSVVLASLEREWDLWVYDSDGTELATIPLGRPTVPPRMWNIEGGFAVLQ